MVKIKRAEHIGFCAGVRRAISLVEQTLRKAGPSAVYCLKPIIHNPQVMQRLQEQGLHLAGSLNDIPKGAILILPSHGSPRKLRAQALAKKIKLVDVMCPYVASVHSICENMREQGYHIAIIGDAAHPEIQALVDLVPQATVIGDVEDIKAGMFDRKKVGIISQTTHAEEKFSAIVRAVIEKNPGVSQVHMYNTICLDTSCRQAEVKGLAASVDVLVVIGSRTSANTNRLYTLGRKINRRTFLVDGARSNALKKIGRAGTVGIISGASAPDWLVDQVVEALQKL